MAFEVVKYFRSLHISRDGNWNDTTAIVETTYQSSFKTIPLSVLVEVCLDSGAEQFQEKVYPIVIFWQKLQYQSDAQFSSYKASVQYSHRLQYRQ